MEHPAGIITAFQLLATPVLAKVVDVKCLACRFARFAHVLHGQVLVRAAARIPEVSVGTLDTA